MALRNDRGILSREGSEENDGSRVALADSSGGEFEDAAHVIETIRVLFLGEREECARIRLALSTARDFHYVVDQSTTLQSAAAAVGRKAYDVCLLDTHLLGNAPGELIRSSRNLFTLPLILLTEDADEDIAAGAAQTGAVDHLIKSEITASLLDRSIRYSIERVKSLGSLQESREFLRSTLDALSSHIAILDETGTIVSVNKAWAEFGREGCFPGENYVAVCEKENHAGDRAAGMVAQGIRDVTEGRWTSFFLEYSRNLKGVHYWFALHVTRFVESGAPRIVVAHDDITERKQAEEALAASEKRFRALIENSSDITMLTNRSGEVVYASPAVIRTLGYATEEFLGSKGIDFVHPGDLELLASAKERIAAPGAVARLRIRVRHQDGSWRWMDGTVTNYLDDPGVGARVFNLQDYTARKRAEEELSRSEAKFQFLSDAGVIGILEVGLDGTIYSANDALLKMVGREAENVADGHLNLFAINAPEYQELTSLGLLTMKASRTLEPYEKEYLHKNGSRIPVMVGGARIGTTSDRFIGFVIDLSKLTQAREEIKRSEQRYSNLFENANDAILTHDTEGRVTQINRAGERLLGYSREELINRDFGEIWVPESQAVDAHIVARVLANELPERLEVEMRTRRGKRVHAELSMQPILEGGQISGFQCIARDLSEKGSLEEQLRQAQTTEAVGRREAKELLQSVADTIPAIVFMTDEQGRNVFCNQAWSDFSGQPVEAAYGYGWQAMLHPDDTPALGFVPGFDEDGFFELPRRMKRADGQYRQMIVRGRRLLRADGTFSGLVGVVTDTTDQRRADDRIRTLSRAVEQSPVSIVITDAKGTIEYVNPRFTATTGYSVEEAIGQNSRMLKSGRTSPEEYRELWATIRNGEWRGEFWNRRKDGGLFLELASISPVRNQQGEVTHFLAVKEDITEQRRREKALRHAEELNQRILASAREGISVTDLQGEIQYMSPGAMKLCDNSDASCTRTNWIEFWSPEYRPAAICALQKCREGTSSAVQGMATTCQGNKRWLDASLTRMEGDPDTDSQIVIVFRDITERRQMETQLAQAQKLESIGQLAAGIAHEINTPIQYVGDNGTFIRDAFKQLVPYVERLEAAAPPGSHPAAATQSGARPVRGFAYFKKEIPRAAEELLEGVESVARIVRAMKDFSHPGSTEKTVTDLNRAVESVVTVSRNEWKYVAELKTDLDPDLPLVNCLPGEINQVILNLIVNAAHAIAGKQSTAPAEAGVISVSTRDCEGSVEIRIADNGTGIPDAIRGKIFDPFFTTKEVGKGTGQGLAIAHDVIVQKHGGSISVETEVGKGTSFLVRLPLGEST